MPCWKFQYDLLSFTRNKTFLHVSIFLVVVDYPAHEDEVPKLQERKKWFHCRLKHRCFQDIFYFVSKTIVWDNFDIYYVSMTCDVLSIKKITITYSNHLGNGYWVFYCTNILATPHSVQQKTAIVYLLFFCYNFTLPCRFIPL